MANGTTPLYLRADAYRSIGAGHVMRCLALAQAHADVGGRAVFVGRIEGEGLLGRLADEGFAHAPVPEGVDAATPAGCVAALEHAGAVPGDRVVLDGYTFAPGCAASLRRAGFVVLELDDLNARDSWEAHAVLNQDPGVGPAAYPPAPGTLVLAGPRYRLLRREFRGDARAVSGDSGEGLRVVLTFGGADSRNVSLAALRVLDRVLGPDDTVRVAVGPVNPHRESLERAAADAAYACELLDDVRDMPALMRWGDLALAAAGGTAWELAALGVPAVLVPVADNQRPNARVLAAAGAAVALDGVREMEGDALPRSAAEVLLSADKREAMAAAGRALCDGRGAERALEALDALAGHDAVLRLRETGPQDVEHVFRLANDPDKRRFAFSPQAIPLDGHREWFAARLAARDETAMYVLDCAGAVAAEARYDRRGDDAEVDVSVLAAFRGRGLGPRILTESGADACARLGVVRLRAEVFMENTASRRCFEKAGYALRGEETIKGRQCAVYEWEKA